MGEFRKSIIASQSKKAAEDRKIISDFSSDTGWKKVSVSNATQTAHFILESQNFWYAYGGNGQLSLEKMKDKTQYSKFNYNATIAVLKKMGMREADAKLLKGIDCIGVFKYIYKMNGISTGKGKADALGTTVSTIKDYQKTKNGASVVSGNIYEIGSENVPVGSAIYKYTWDEKNKKWIVGHIGYYDGNKVIEAKSKNDGIIESDLSECDAYSWLSVIKTSI